jgi:hypothetical protein
MNCKNKYASFDILTPQALKKLAKEGHSVPSAARQLNLPLASFRARGPQVSPEAWAVLGENGVARKYKKPIARSA